MGASLKIIDDDSLQITENGVMFGIRLNWYRSLPLSCVTIESVEVEEKTISKENISFCYDGGKYKIDEMENMTGKYWYVQDSAGLSVDLPEKAELNRDYKIGVTISLRMPYIPVGPVKFLTIPTKFTSVQKARQEEK